MTNIVHQLEQERTSQIDIPEIWPGDTVAAHLNIIEGERKRTQLFEGIVIAKRDRGHGSSITLRKISNGIGVERVIPIYAPTVAKLEVKRRGKVRRAKLYYLRELSGKAARIAEKLTKKSDKKKED